MRETHEERRGEELRKTLRLYTKPSKFSSMLKKKPKKDIQIQKWNYIEHINPEKYNVTTELLSKHLRDPVNNKPKSSEKLPVHKHSQELSNDKKQSASPALNNVKISSSGYVKINLNNNLLSDVNKKKLLCHKLKRKMQIHLLNKKLGKKVQLQNKLIYPNKPPKVHIPNLSLDDDIPDFSLESESLFEDNSHIDALNSCNQFTNIPTAVCGNNKRTVLTQNPNFGSSSFKSSILNFMKSENDKKFLK
jgi:hypothetical protein